MKKTALIGGLLFSVALSAQNTDCTNRILAMEGNWQSLKQTLKAPAADYAVQKKIYQALHQSLIGLRPMGWEAQYSGSFLGKAYGNPLPEFSYTLYAMLYDCREGSLQLRHETNSKLFVLFNRWPGLVLHDHVSADNELGFESFRDGWPAEVHPGVWQFADQKEALGFGNEGVRKTWLFTRPGALPWQWVSRREFLDKRRRYLLNLLKEQEAQSYNAKLTTELTSIIESINIQLESSAPELAQGAIVLRSTQKHNEFLFVEAGTPGALLLIKPNPGYFEKKLPPATPQFFMANLVYDPKHPASAAFANAVEAKLDFRYLQSFVCRVTPLPLAGASTTATICERKEDKAQPGVKAAVSKQLPARKRRKAAG